MPSFIPEMDKHRWEDEYNLAVQTNSKTRTIVPAKKNDLRVWKGYLTTRDGQLHTMELRLEYPAHEDGRTLFYPVHPPSVEWQTPIHHPNIQPPRPIGDGQVCLRPLDRVHPENWNPKTHIVELLNLIELLVNSPDPTDPVNHPVCLQTAIAMLRGRIKDAPSRNLIERQLHEAESIIHKYERVWNKVKSKREKDDRDRAWYLIKLVGGRLVEKTK